MTIEAIILLLLHFVLIATSWNNISAWNDSGQRWNKIGDPQGDNNTVMDSRAASDRYEANIVYK